MDPINPGVAKEATQMSLALEALAEALEQAERLVERLTVQLNGVLRPTVEKTKPTDAAPLRGSQSPAVKSILGEAARVTTVNAQLEEILERLDI